MHACNLKIVTISIKMEQYIYVNKLTVVSFFISDRQIGKSKVPDRYRIGTKWHVQQLLKMFLFVFQTGYNVVPSISAVTGISPGRYLWRIVIAFHLGPRILIAAVYHNFLKSFEKALDPDSASVLKKMLKGCYYLQICEIIGLCGISFIHNREHYRKCNFNYLLTLEFSVYQESILKLAKALAFLSISVQFLRIMISFWEKSVLKALKLVLILANITSIPSLHFGRKNMSLHQKILINIPLPFLQ